MWSRGFSRVCCDITVQCYSGERAATLGGREPLLLSRSGVDTYGSYFQVLSQPGASVFVPTLNLPAFLRTFAKLPPTASLVLVTGQEDLGTPRELWDEDKPDYRPRGNLKGCMHYRELLADPRLRHWFAQNYDLTGCSPWGVCSPVAESDPLAQKMSPIPIGIDFHSLSEKQHRRSVAEQVEDLYRARGRGKRLREKNGDVLFMPHRLTPSSHTPGPSRDGMDQIRLPENKTVKWRGSRDEMWEKIATEYMFVSAPFGHGMDTHRMWETLNLGSVPVVRTSPLDRLYRQFPVVIVSNWSSVNEASFQLWKDDISARFGPEPFGEKMYEKFQMQFWIGMVQEKATPGSDAEHIGSRQCLPAGLGAPTKECR